MFRIVRVQDTVRVLPKYFGKSLEQSVLAITQEEYEGLLDEDLGIVVAVTKAKKIGEGRVVMGDGSAYFKAELDLLIFKPAVHEIVEGKVNEITEFGAFVSLGAMEGLIHVSQIMDEYLNYDAKGRQFVAKESKRSLKAEDTVLARVVTVSLKGSIQESKIGLTMRQPYLGKWDWIEREIEKEKKKKETKPKEEKEKKKKTR
jgi:DNA-directed RNA polymerase subunit E'